MALHILRLATAKRDSPSRWTARGSDPNRHIAPRLAGGCARAGGDMKAITLWPEWAYAVAWLGKRIENRDWPPPRSLIGERVAIHAGAHVGGRKGRPAMEEGMQAVKNAASDEGLGFKGIGWRGDHFPYEAPQFSLDGQWRNVVTGAIVCTAVVDEAVQTLFAGDIAPPWANPHAEWWWKLRNVEVLAVPFRCIGKQGLWDVPDAKVAQVWPWG